MSAILPELVRVGGKLPDDPTLPAEPLLEWLRAHPDRMAGWSLPGRKKRKTADRLELARAAAARRLADLKRADRVLFATADTICALLDVHPAELWGDDYWRAEL